MPKQITEAQTLTVAEAATPGRLRLQLVDSGWGSSGYYSPQVLENAAADKVYAAGTHVFFDHPGEAERYDRPERSVRDLAMVLDEDAHYDPDTRALVAEAKVIGPYRELVTDPVFMEAVGMSIRATADTTVGEADGRKGTLVTRLIEGVSVDLVTRAGRGGRILAAVESARRDLNEATATDVDAALSDAAKDHDRRSYVVDHDPDAGLVYVRTYSDDDRSRVRSYPYTYDAPNAVVDWDSPTEVRPVTSFVPIGASSAPTDAPAPAGQSTATESQEMNMANIQIEEAELGRLRQDAERVPTLESDRETALRERDEAREALAARDRADRITAVVESVDGHGTLSTLERRGLAADARNGEDGQLDETALRTAVETAVAERAEQSGAGHVTGFGTTVDENADTPTVKAAVSEAFGRRVQED